MNNFLLAQDAINGKEGCAVVQNEGKNSVLFGLKKNQYGCRISGVGF